MKLIILIASLLPTIATAAAKNNGTQSGRFQIVQPNEMRRDQYLLDTETGKLWRASCLGSHGADCDVSYWSEEMIENKNTTMQKIVEVYNRVNEGKQQNAEAPAAK